MKVSYVLSSQQQARPVLSSLWDQIRQQLNMGNRLVVSVKPETRSLDQNAKLWACLTDVSEQVEWYGKRLTCEDWKHVFSSSLRKLEVVPNIDGTGFVALGLSTSAMTKGELSELIELIHAFGADKGVTFKEQA